MDAFDDMIEFARLAGPPRADVVSPANWSIRAIPGSGSRTHLVSLRGAVYFVWDNGGEAGVEKINSEELPRFFPTNTAGANDAGTLYARLCALLLGEELDFGYRAGLCVADLR